VIIAEIDPGDGGPAEMVGYVRGMWRREESGIRIYFIYGRVTPAWRRKGIGAAVLGWMERRMGAIAAGHPADEEKRYECYAEQGEVGFIALLEKAGYHVERYMFDMVRPDLENIPDFPLPEGLEVRPVQPEHYRAIWDADAEAFRDHWGYIPPSEEDYQGWLVDPNLFQPELWQVAWDLATNQVAGQVRTFINHEQNRVFNRKRGYTEFISVGRPWRRRGLARALIARSLQAQKAAGMTESALGVDAENISGALRVYEDCGFEVEKRAALYQKEITAVSD
jgi:GNAT superfamily N-acetyltransferase